MSRLLLNTGSTPLYDRDGRPVVSGQIVHSDELADGHEALYEDGVLVYVRPADVPDTAILSEGAKAHLAEWADERGNAEPAVRDDAGVKKSTSKGGQS